jgi:hypothetical protein
MISHGNHMVRNFAVASGRHVSSAPRGVERMAGAPCPRHSAITEDALYEAGCDDALIAVVNGRMFLDFHRHGRHLKMP